MDYLLVFVTIPARLSAQDVVRALLDVRCIAGANAVPAVATWFRDETGLHETRETILFCRTLPEQLERLRAALRVQVGSDEFEISPIPITAGNPAYSAWVRSALG
jgi:uncharacterized protein involved in tolerance to divalent cations